MGAADGVAETTAANGIPVVLETTPFFKSVSFGIWIKSGSRDEAEDKSGLFHFLEHLVFKGTPTRNASSIAMEIDSLGGHIDAFTSREVTCYFGHVLTERLEHALDLVADIMLNSSFPEDEVERERQVILEEIRMGEDNPSDHIHDKLYPMRWGNHPLGRPITGVADTVKAINREDLVKARDRFYRPPNIVITACGDVELEKFTKLVDQRFGHLERMETSRELSTPSLKSTLKVIQRPLEQVHMLVAMPGLPMTHEKRHSLSILNTIFGGGVSSRLFQRVREERGLAYSIYSFYDQYIDAGLFGIYAACSQPQLKQAWDAILKEIEAIVKNPPTEDEITRAKTMGADNLKMSFESLSSRTTQMAHQKLYYDRLLSLDEMLDDLMSVSARSVRDLATELFTGEDYTILALGPVKENELKWLSP